MQRKYAVVRKHIGQLGVGIDRCPVEFDLQVIVDSNDVPSTSLTGKLRHDRGERGRE